MQMCEPTIHYKIIINEKVDIIRMKFTVEVDIIRMKSAVEVDIINRKSGVELVQNE